MVVAPMTNVNEVRKMPIRCAHSSQIPKVDHWAIIEDGSVHIPGDERSRTNPGHGYPASTEYYCTYTAYLDKAEWALAIHDLTFPKYGSPKSFRAIQVIVPDIKVTVNVDVKER
jgi:hypothetical protein